MRRYNKAAWLRKKIYNRTCKILTEAAIRGRLRVADCDVCGQITNVVCNETSQVCVRCQQKLENEKN